MGFFGIVTVFVKTTVRPVGTTVTGAGRTIAPAAGKRLESRAVRSALPVKGAFSVCVAFHWKGRFMRQNAMTFDFLADGRRVFSDRLRDRRFCGTVVDAIGNDASFFQGEMSMSIDMIRHEKHLP